MADIQRIVIELAADTSELQPAFDQLEALGKIDQKTAESFRQTNAAIAQRSKVLGEVKNQQTAVTEGSKQTAKEYEKLSQAFAKASQTIATGASKEVIEGFFDGVDDALKEAGVSVDEFAQKVGAGLGKSSPLNEAGNSSKSLKAQLRELKQELAALNPTDAKFGELAKQAGELEDKIGDVNLQVRNLASDTAALDGTIQGIQGVAGAFQIAEGSAALFGAESKELQETLIRLTALLNITNGLQQIQTILQRQSAAAQLVANAQTKIGIALKTVEGATESRNVIIRTAATAAQWLLNAAMLANPAGILVAAIGALAGALIYFTRNSETAAEAQAKLNEKQLESLRITQELEKTFNKFSEDRTRALERELNIAKARGASALELANIEKDIADEKLAQAKVSQAFFNQEKGNIDKLTQSYQNLLITLDLEQSKKEPNEKRIEQINQELSLIKGQIDLNVRLARAVEDATDQQIIAEINLQKVRDAGAGEDAERLKEEERLRQEAAKKRAEDAQKERDRQRQLYLDRLAEEKALIQALIIESKEGSDERLALEQALIQKEAQIGIASLDDKKNLENAKLLIETEANDKSLKKTRENARKKREAEFEALGQVNTIDTNVVAAQLAAVEKGTQEELRLKNDAIELAADAEKLAAQQKFELGAKSVNDEKIFKSEIVRIDAEANAEKSANNAAFYENQTEQARAAAEEQKKLQQDIANASFQILSAALASQGKVKQQQIATDQQEQLDALDKAKDAELKNRNLTNAQREKIDEKYRKKEADIKLAAWEAQQDALVTQAIMQASLAFINTLASVPYPYNIIAAGLIAGLTAIQVSEIENQEPPKFAKGVERLKGKGTQTSDSIPALLSRDERVVSAKTNLDYYPALSAIHNRKVSPQVANALLSGNPYQLKGISPDIVNQSMMFTSGGIDADKVGKSIATYLHDDMEILTDVNMEVVNAINSLPERMPVHRSQTINMRYR